MAIGATEKKRGTIQVVNHNTNTVRDALPEIFSGETEDANRWVNAMEVYFQVNPSTFTTDDAKVVTLLNRMSKG